MRAPARRSAPDPDGHPESLERYLEAEAASGRFSGVVLVTSGGATGVERGLGLADRANGLPATPGTRFGLASAGKAFTAAAIARLVARGALAFATPVVDLLPLPLRPRALSSAVTVHHLLTHTSGLADYFDEERLGADAYARTWDAFPSYRARRPADFLPLFADLPPRQEPGRSFAYCNAGYILLGLVIEVATGLPFPTAIKAEVFDPIGMTGAGYFPLDEPRPDLAVGYLPPAADDQPWRSNVFSIPAVGGADGGAQCTARDLDRFLTALAAGDLLPPETADRMTAAQVAVPDGDAYGYGVWLRAGRAPARIALVGEDPGFSARAYRYPDGGVHVVVLSNVSGGAGPAGRALPPLLGVERGPA